MSRANARASFAASTYPQPPRSTGAPSLWVQPGGPGTPIETVDPLASVQSGVGHTVSVEVSVCLGGSSNTVNGLGGGTCLGGFQNTVSGSSASIIGCFECEATGTTSTCLASNSALASGFCAACIATTGTASGDFSACIGGQGGTASGKNAVEIGGGNAAGAQSVALGAGSSAPNDNDIAIGAAAANVGFFGATCVPQQPGGGSGTAGPAYTANEQQMLQAVYSALVKLGLIT